MQIIFGVLLVLTTLGIQAAPSAKDLQTQLQTIQKTNQILTNEIYQTQRKEKKLLKQLEKMDITIGHFYEQLRDIQAEKTQLEKEHSRCLARKQQLEKNFAHHEKVIAYLVRHRYSASENEKIKLMLSENNWGALMRQSAYYQRVYQLRKDILTETQDYLGDIERNEEALKQQQSALKHIIHSIHKAQSELENKKTQRQGILAKIQQQRKSKETEQEQLLKQEQHIVALLNNLIQNSQNIPVNTTNISSLKGQLQHPLGKSYIASTTQSKQKSFFPAKMGSPIEAIHSGKVVFSQWLRGMGLLLILDHGEGMLSLYGNTQILYKKLGETVQQGEMIARVGESGTYGTEGLYFEIRKDGLAQNTPSWIRG